MEGNKPVQVILAGRHQLVLDGLRSVLEQAGEFEVLAVAQGPDELLAVDELDAADVVILDVSLSCSPSDGLEAVAQLRASYPAQRVLWLSNHTSQEIVTAALEAGVQGYVTKGESAERLTKAVRAVARGQTYLSQAVVQHVVGALYDGGSGPGSSALTTREREVLCLLAEGYSTQRAADRLGVSSKTVATHREKLMRKIDVHSVAGLTRFAVRRGLVSAERSDAD